VRFIYAFAPMRVLASVSWRRALGLLIVVLVAAAAGLGARADGALRWIERRSVDARFSLRGSIGPPRGVVLVAIDNETVAHLPRYPFSRTYDARVLERLHAAGARLIVFDVAFERPTSEAADLALFGAAQRAAPVVFAAPLVSQSGETQILGGNANLESIGARAGAADFSFDGDGVIRHTLAQVNGLPTIAFAAASDLGVSGLEKGQREGAWLDFRGPPESVPSISFMNVVKGRFDRSSVRGKVVVIGATAPVLQDIHSTTVGEMSGPEIQAQAIGTVLAGFPLRGPPASITVLLICVLSLSIPILALRLGTLSCLAGGLVVAAAWSLAVQLAFDHGAVLDYSDPLASLTLGCAGSLLVTLSVDSRERKRLRTAFAADSGTLVDEVLHAPGSRALEPTAIISGYSLEQVIGRGGMGVVYKAEQLELGRTVAVKLIASERSADPAVRERFKLESRLAASIDHANVIPVYEAGEDDGLLFIAMRLVEGVDLAQLLRRVGTLEPSRALRVVEQLAGALDAAHSLGIVHRDVKPANVLLTLAEPEHLYLTDFGVSKSVGADGSLTRQGEWVGTLDYLAPEQLRGGEVSAAVDIYALAGMLYHCLTGEPPFPRDSDGAKVLAHISEPPPRASERVASLPGAIDAVIARGLAKDPAARYPSAWSLARAAASALGLVSQLTAPLPTSAASPGELDPDAPTRVPD
jgi:CHASE2 domain-containing sensor protein/predicted Ser/Thr protein kinase